MKDAQVQLVGPPVAIRCASAGLSPTGVSRYGTLAFTSFIVGSPLDAMYGSILDVRLMLANVLIV